MGSEWFMDCMAEAGWATGGMMSRMLSKNMKWASGYGGSGVRGCDRENGVIVSSSYESFFAQCVIIHRLSRANLMCSEEAIEGAALEAWVLLTDCGRRDEIGSWLSSKVFRQLRKNSVDKGAEYLLSWVSAVSSIHCDGPSGWIRDGVSTCVSKEIRARMVYETSTRLE